MRLLAFMDDAVGRPALGARDGDTVIHLTAEGHPSTLDALLLLGNGGLDRIRATIAGKPRHRIPLDRITWLPPLLNPSKAFGIGLNYSDHAREIGAPPPSHPVIFQRFPSSWVAHGQAMVRSQLSTQFDYEAELVVVIGQAGRNIPRDRALKHVAGYSIFNDGTVRDYQARSHQWLWGKNFDASGGFGPEFVTADELPPGARGLNVQCRLNGQLLQDGNTRDMIFDVAALVSACSEGIGLHPGDMIITGTPAGVGFVRQPPVWMRPGDVCEVEIEGIGTLVNPIKAEA